MAVGADGRGDIAPEWCVSELWGIGSAGPGYMLALAPPTHKAHRAPTTHQLSSRFDSRATHACPLLPAALASVLFGFVLVRVRVRINRIDFGSGLV